MLVNGTDQRSVDWLVVILASKSGGRRELIHDDIFHNEEVAVSRNIRDTMSSYRKDSLF